MKVKEIIYQRLFSFGFYQNERIGFVVELDEGEDENQAVVALAKKAADLHHVLDIIRAINDRRDSIAWRCSEAPPGEKKRYEDELRELAEAEHEIMVLLRKGDVPKILEKYGHLKRRWHD